MSEDPKPTVIEITLKEGAPSIEEIMEMAKKLRVTLTPVEPEEK